MAVENILQAAKTAFAWTPMRLKLFSRGINVAKARNEQATFEALVRAAKKRFGAMPATRRAMRRKPKTG